MAGPGYASCARHRHVESRAGDVETDAGTTAAVAATPSSRDDGSDGVPQPGGGRSSNPNEAPMNLRVNRRRFLRFAGGGALGLATSGVTVRGLSTMNAVFAAEEIAVPS